MIQWLHNRLDAFVDITNVNIASCFWLINHYVLPNYGVFTSNGQKQTSM